MRRKGFLVKSGSIAAERAGCEPCSQGNARYKSVPNLHDITGVDTSVSFY